MYKNYVFLCNIFQVIHKVTLSIKITPYYWQKMRKHHCTVSMKLHPPFLNSFGTSSETLNHQSSSSIIIIPMEMVTRKDSQLILRSLTRALIWRYLQLHCLTLPHTTVLWGPHCVSLSLTSYQNLLPLCSNARGITNQLRFLGLTQKVQTQNSGTLLTLKSFTIVITG